MKENFKDKAKNQKRKFFPVKDCIFSFIENNTVCISCSKKYIIVIKIITRASSTKKRNAVQPAKQEPTPAPRLGINQIIRWGKMIF